MWRSWYVRSFFFGCDKFCFVFLCFDLLLIISLIIIKHVEGQLKVKCGDYAHCVCI